MQIESTVTFSLVETLGWDFEFEGFILLHGWILWRVVQLWTCSLRAKFNVWLFGVVGVHIYNFIVTYGLDVECVDAELNSPW